MTIHEPVLETPSLRHRLTPYLAVVAALAAGCVFALFAGSTSQTLAQMSVQAGGPNFMREPINAAIAVLLFLMWRRWRPSARFSSPKWGHIAFGLVMGLFIGIALPGLALWLLSVTKNAVITAPSINPIALGVPFVFLILHGFAEESLIRGLAQREGHYRFGPLVGIGVAALCFCALQALQGYIGVWNVVNGVLFGACLGFLALGPGGIWAAIGAHAGWSWLEIAVLGQSGQIVKAKTWVAGSGPDSYGSPAFTCVLVALLGLQLALHYRAKERKA